MSKNPDIIISVKSMYNKISSHVKPIGLNTTTNPIPNSQSVYFDNIANVIESVASSETPSVEVRRDRMEKLLTSI
jgi:hypothetical protein